MTIHSHIPCRGIVRSTLIAIVSLLYLEGHFASASDASSASTDTITCQVGWGGSMERAVIPADQINDGYCDCPYDGADETETEACSGATVGGWPGISSDNDESLLFACLRQPRLRLPISRVNDGICDCCDGSDETARGTCPDICKQVLAEEIAAAEKMKKDFQIGYDKRNQDLEDFALAVEDTTQKVQELTEEMASLDGDKIRDEIALAKRTYFEQRVVTAKMMAENESIAAIFKPQTDDELVSFIVHSCQIAGEMGDALEESTCVPLRLAGFDASVVWDDEDFQNPENSGLVKDFDQIELIDAIAENSMNGEGEPVWKLGSASNGRRRLQEDDEYTGDEDYMGDYDHHVDEYPDDDYMEEDYDYNRAKRAFKNDFNNDGDAKHQEAIIDEIKQTMFGKTRLIFLERAAQVSEEISKLLDSQDDDKEEEEGDEKNAEVPADFDPAQLTMVRSTLKRREDIIVRGLEYAASAKHLLQQSQLDQMSNEARRNFLVSLASGVLFHGKLQTLHVWQILQTILPELNESLSLDSETCASPWAGACPPRTTRRDSAGGLPLPPDYTYMPAQTFCNEQVDDALNGACGVEQAGKLPAFIPDGYYGYKMAMPRERDDFLSTIFSPLSAVVIQKEQLDVMVNELDKLEKRSTQLQSDIDGLWNAIGGPNQNRMGPDGELYGIRDTCNTVTAGKYEYDLCIFGQAYQRDKGTSTKSGTGLGKWRKMQIDESTGERIFRWEGGQKCWNGPQRSATAYVTCGAETKVLSADEPQTCTYAMKMESHLACDDAFKQLHNL